MLCLCGGRRRQEGPHFASKCQCWSPVIQTTPGESRELEEQHGRCLVGVGLLLGCWYQSCSWRDRQECWLWIKHSSANLTSTIQQHLVLKRCQASPQRVRLRVIRLAEFFRSVRIAALVCMPNMHTSVVLRAAGEIVAATRKTCCYASASSGLTNLALSSRATGSLVMCPFAVLIPSRIASLCAAASRAPSVATCN